MQCSDVTTIVWGNTLDTANYHLRHAFWSDLCHVWQKFLGLPFSLLEFKINDRGVPFAFQITVCWKSLTCRQFFLRGIRLISMKSKEHTIPSKFALLWVFLYSRNCFTPPDVILVFEWLFSRWIVLFLDSARALTPVAAMPYSKKWLRWESNTKRSWQNCTRNVERSVTELHHNL